MNQLASSSPLESDTEAPEQTMLGAITMFSASRFSFICDRLAVSSDGDLYCACVCGGSTTLKSLFAFLNTNAKGHIEIPDAIKYEMKLSNSAGRVVTPRTINKLAGGYRIYREKIGYKMWHVALVTRATNFLPSINDEAIWQHLMQPQYTTPLVRQWVPWLRSELVYKGKLKETYGFQTRCGLIDLKTKELDKMVSGGLRLGELAIPSEEED